MVCVVLAGIGSLSAAEAAKTYDNQIFFEFSDRQLEKFERVSKDRSRQDFKLRIRAGSNDESHRITAHLRGQGSLRYCERKSYTIDMPGRDAWDLIAGSRANQFYLLSMCQDQDYLRTATVLRIWKKLGLFPLEFRYVELLINGQTQGLYMLIEQPDDALPRALPGLLSVVRRRFDRQFTYPDVQYSSTDETIAKGDYVNAFQNLDHHSREQFITELESRLDVPQFILHLAVAAALYNGDYVDELWFLQLPISGNADGSYRYRVMKWDPDDTFRNCHYGTRYAWPDPWGITKCAESELAAAILSHPPYYRRFVDQLAGLLENELTPGRFNSELDQTAGFLSASLTSDRMVRVMEQFQDDLANNTDRAGALRQINRTRDELSKLFKVHHSNLRSLINRYHELRD